MFRSNGGDFSLDLPFNLGSARIREVYNMCTVNLCHPYQTSHTVVITEMASTECWPEYRCGHISGVLIRGSSLY